MKIFIAKTYTVVHYGFKRLDEEKGFDSYEKALNYLQTDFFEEDDVNKSYLKDYFAEIVEYNLCNNEVIITKTRFNCLGKVFATLKSTDNYVFRQNQKINKSFTPTFKEGDIVLLTYHAHNSLSLFNDTIGVVTGVPNSYHEWKKEYNLPDEVWEPIYFVEFIEDTGFLTHTHPMEEEMQLFNKKLPDELILLEKLSKHFKKEKIIDERILKALRSGDIYALNQKTINDIDWE